MTPQTTTNEVYKVVTCDEIETDYTKDDLIISATIKAMLEDVGEFKVILLPNVTHPVFAKIMEYCHWLAAQPKKDELMKVERITDDANESYHESVSEWEINYMKSMSHEMLKNVTLAVNYLEINRLFGLCSHKNAMIIRELKNVDAIRKYFGIQPDFTKEEEEQIRKENQWAQEQSSSSETVTH